MSLAEDVAAAAAEVGTSAQAAADRVTAAIGGLRTQLADAQAQIQALIDAGNADAVQLTATLDTLAAADAIVDSIEAAPVEEPPV
jgi:chromosome condensin MukBEF ATPase and DNA-binding subunit MukB